MMSNNKLLINQMGSSANSYMKFMKTVSQIIPNQPYKLVWDDLYHIQELGGGRIKNVSPKIVKPKSILVNFNIEKNSFVTNSPTIDIPIEIATDEKVAYYSCQLIETMELFRFNLHNDKKMYYYQINIGEDYLNDYIMSGKGVTLELHDNPNFYTPSFQNSNGFIILAKKVGFQYELTGFKIPYEKGLYINSNIYHSNCFINGIWKIASSNIIENDNTKTIIAKNKPVQFIYKN